MKTVVEDSGPCRKVLRVEAPPERVRTIYDQVVQEFRKDAHLDGFRRGHAPAELVARKYADSIRADVRDRLARETYDHALAESKLDVFELVDLQLDEVTSPDSAWRATYTVDVRPDFPLPNYKGLLLPRQKVEVTEDEVDQVVEGLRADRATYKDIEGRPAAAGDLVRVDFSGTLEGRPLEEVVPESRGLGRATDFWLHLHEQSFLPGFVESITGASVGEQRTITVNFPSDFSIPAVRGLTVIYEVKVTGLREQVLPAADEPEFLKSLGVSTLDELRSQIRRRLIAIREQEENRRRRAEAVEQLLRATPTDLPSREVSRVTDERVRSMVEMLVQRGLPDEKIREQSGQILATARQAAVKDVHARILFERIAAAEGIQVSRDEVDEAIRQIALAEGEDPNKFLERAKDSGGWYRVWESLLSRKVLDFILAHAREEA